MIKIAATLGVPGSYLARVCSVVAEPRPERYWAKLAVGKGPPMQPHPSPNRAVFSNGRTAHR
jgi:hypothetical protein